jgi:hypothetical protein
MRRKIHTQLIRAILPHKENKKEDEVNASLASLFLFLCTVPTIPCGGAHASSRSERRARGDTSRSERRAGGREQKRRNRIPHFRVIAQHITTRCQHSPSAQRRPHEEAPQAPRQQAALGEHPKARRSPRRASRAKATAKRQRTTQHRPMQRTPKQRTPKPGHKGQGPVSGGKLRGAGQRPNPPKRQIHPKLQVPAHNETHTHKPPRRPTDRPIDAQGTTAGTASSSSCTSRATK